MKKSSSSLWLVGILFAVMILAGCGTDSTPAAVEETSAGSSPYLVFTDDSGQEVILPNKPERIVILAPEALNLFYQLGGSVVGFASTPGAPIPEEAKAALDVGHVDNVSMELITSLKPDLVIGQYFFNAGLEDSFVSSGVPFALVKIISYEDLQHAGKLFGQIIGNESQTETALKEMDERIQSIVGKLPEDGPAFAQVTIMPMGVYIQKDGSMTTDIARRLKLKNAAAGMTGGELPDYVPFSLEKLIIADPEYMFMMVHGTEELGRKKLKEDMESNPAWSSLRAVMDDKLHFLPSTIENAPGLHIDADFKNVAKIAYPGVFGK
ncbi:ABC transporter substrate-binding protein [Paenibacillus alkalitolerans]|uniref:ABC transporter substrate-binding protein n=1 Tax=Paenibacillus alkalitolerans TaxID=2799335 RepID=UPI0018F78751|nr:ABC transporter substrate-binding protein [Paenibacillus alkalitolerans]